MNLYILPVHRVLLEYVLKLGDMIFFPGNVSNDDLEIEQSFGEKKINYDSLRKRTVVSSKRF